MFKDLGLKMAYKTKYPPENLLGSRKTNVSVPGSPEYIKYIVLTALKIMTDTAKELLEHAKVNTSLI